MITASAFFESQRLVHLALIDLAIIIFYFALVLCIGFYLRERSNTGEDFFMAGREMTAWVAGLAFLSANLGSLELMGWARRFLPIRNFGGALVLDWRNSRHAFSGAGDDALLLHLQNAFRPWLPAVAFR